MKLTKNNNKTDIIIFFLTKVFSGILSFIAISIFTYYLKPDLYGEYSLIQGIINILVSIFIGWLSSASLRYYDDYKESREKFFSNLFIDYLISLIVVLLITLVMASVSININIKEYLLFSILLFITYSLSDLFCSIIRASKETKTYFLIVIGQYVINISAFLLMTLVYKLELNAIFISYIFSYGLISLYCVFHYKIFKYIKFNQYSIIIQKKILKYGLPMVGVWATNWILNYSDRYIIKLFFSSNEVGFYDIAYKLSENSINIIITSISMAMMPHIIEAYKKGGNSKSNAILKNYIRIFNILIIPSIFGLIGIRNHLYGTLISKDYISGVNTIIYIAVSMFFFGICQLLYKIWQLNEKTSNILKLMIISVILNIILNIIFIPKFGFEVAAVTTLFSNIITFIFTYFFIKKNYLFKLDFSNFFKVLFSSIIMFIFIICFNNFVKNILWVVIEIVFSIIIYVNILFLLKGLEPEKKLIKNFLNNKIKNN